MGKGSINMSFDILYVSTLYHLFENSETISKWQSGICSPEFISASFIEYSSTNLFKTSSLLSSSLFSTS
jgi:hypothetical protein